MKDKNLVKLTSVAQQLASFSPDNLIKSWKDYPDGEEVVILKKVGCKLLAKKLQDVISSELNNKITPTL